MITRYFLQIIFSRNYKKYSNTSVTSYMYYISDHGENLFDNGNAVYTEEQSPQVTTCMYLCLCGHQADTTHFSLKR